MLTQLSRNWWLLALRGVAAIIFGILAFVWPGVTLLVLVLFFGAYALVDGVFAIIAAFKNRKTDDRWWVMLLIGVVSIAAGLIAFFIPEAAAFALLAVIAAWAILSGALGIIAAIRLRKEIEGEWLMVLAGVLSILFGILLVWNPLAGLVAIVYLVGAYSIVNGILLLALAWKVKGLGTAPQGMTASAA
jgi:uncharacterized membrane protein HdeD (DUF308 family)